MASFPSSPGDSFGWPGFRSTERPLKDGGKVTMYLARGRRSGFVKFPISVGGDRIPCQRQDGVRQPEWRSSLRTLRNPHRPCLQLHTLIVLLIEHVNGRKKQTTVPKKKLFVRISVQDLTQHTFLKERKKKKENNLLSNAPFNG